MTGRALRPYPHVIASRGHFWSPENARPFFVADATGHPPASHVTLANVSEIIFVVEEAPEGGYTARALGESIFAEAETLEELHAQVKDAVICHYDEQTRPKVIRLHFVRDEVIAAG